MLAGILYKCAALQILCAEPVFCLKPADRFVEEACRLGRIKYGGHGAYAYRQRTKFLYFKTQLLKQRQIIHQCLVLLGHELLYYRHEQHL